MLTMVTEKFMQLQNCVVTNFSTKNKILYTMARVFNLYGENDKFSIVSKLIDSNKNKKFFYIK